MTNELLKRRFRFLYFQLEDNVKLFSRYYKFLLLTMGSSMSIIYNFDNVDPALLEIMGLTVAQGSELFLTDEKAKQTFIL